MLIETKLIDQIKEVQLTLKKVDFLKSIIEINDVEMNIDKLISIKA